MLLEFTFLFVTMISGWAYAAPRASCVSTFEGLAQHSTSPELEIFKSFRQRHLEQRKLNPRREYHFSTMDVFGKTVRSLKKKLVKRVDRLEKLNASKRVEISAKDLKFAKAVLEFSEKTIRDGYMYDDVFMLSYWYSWAMSISMKKNDPDAEIIPHTAGSLRKITFYNEFKHRHPAHGYYFFQEGDGTLMDLIRRRNSFLYTAGLIDKTVLADDMMMSPNRFWDHDVSSHARSATTDAYYLKTLGVETEEALIQHLEMRNQNLKVVDRILDDDQVSSKFKEFLEKALFEGDHENDETVLLHDVYLKMMVAYFMSNTPNTMDILYSSVRRDLIFSRSYARREITLEQGNDFKALYKHAQFRKYWNDLMENTRPGQRLQRFQSFLSL